MVEPILLYGAESWTLSISIKKKLDTFDLDCIRTILGYSWFDTISNEELRDRSKQTEMSYRAATKVIRWAGHLWRMDQERIARRVDTWEGKSKGKVKPRWIDNAIGEIRLRGARGRQHEDIKELAKDRKLWQNFLKPTGHLT